MPVIKVKEDQFEDIRSFYHSLIDDMEGSPYYIGWENDVYPSPDFLLESIREGNMYMIRDDSRIISAMVINHQYNEGYDQFHWQTEAGDEELMVIHALGVHPRYARKGYAKEMVRKAIDLAGERGMKAIRLDVLAGNIPAEKLYLELGFQYMDTLEMYYEDTGWTGFKLYEYVI